MQKILGYIEVVGLTLVVLAAALWVLPQENMRLVASIGMAVGTVALVCGRFMQTPFYLKYQMTDPRELTMRRLYHQRVFGIVALILATVFMWLPVGFYAGMYVGKTAWLIPFVYPPSQPLPHHFLSYRYLYKILTPQDNGHSFLSLR